MMRAGCFLAGLALVLAAPAGCSPSSSGSNTLPPGADAAVAGLDGSTGPAGSDVASVPVAPGYSAARDKLLAEVIGPGSEDHPLVAYGFVTPLPKGTKVGVFPAGGAADVLDESAFFFWVDDAPDSMFAHASRFVYVGESTGKVSVQTHDFWPVLGDEAPFGTDGTLPPGAQVVYQSPQAGGTTTGALSEPRHDLWRGALSFDGDANDCPKGEDPPRSYVVLVAGAGRGSKHMSTNINDMDTVLGKLGLGGEVSEQGGRYYIVDASLHADARARLDTHFSAIKNKMRCCDRLLVYVVSHGVRLIVMADESGQQVAGLCYLRNTDKTGINEKSEVTDNCYDLQGNAMPYPDGQTPFPNAKKFWGLEIGDKLVAGERLAAWIKETKTCHATVIVDACYSGGLAGDLAKVPGVRQFIASTAGNETREFDPAAFGTTFSQALLKGLAEVDAGGVAPDKLWSNAFGAQQAKYDPFAKAGADHPHVVNGELPCDCVCPKGIAYCCFGACPVDAWGGCLAPCKDFCKPFADQNKPGKCAITCAEQFGSTPFQCSEIPQRAAECIQKTCP